MQCSVFKYLYIISYLVADCFSEPTSGVDSTAAFSLVDYLVKVAKVTQVAVIMTIHQPSAIGMDDRFVVSVVVIV